MRIDLVSHGFGPLQIRDADIPYRTLKHGAQCVEDLLHCSVAAIRSYAFSEGVPESASSVNKPGLRRPAKSSDSKDLGPLPDWVSLRMFTAYIRTRYRAVAQQMKVETIMGMDTFIAAK